DGPEPRLAIADRLDALLTLAQTLHLVVNPPAEFPAHSFIRASQERFDKRLVLAQHRFQIRLKLQFGMNLRPEMRCEDEGHKEHQLFVALRAKQPAQSLQPRRSLTEIEKHHRARDAEATAQIGVEVGPVGERSRRLLQRAEVFWQFLWFRHQLFE